MSTNPPVLQAFFTADGEVQLVENWALIAGPLSDRYATHAQVTKDGESTDYGRTVLSTDAIGTLGSEANEAFRELDKACRRYNNNPDRPSPEEFMRELNL